MNDAHDLLQTLAVVLCLAAVTTVVFQRLKQPVVFGYLLAGFIASPYTPIPLVADQATVRTLSELGVILLMFSLGLEFSIRKLIRVGPSAGIVAAGQSALMIWLGYTAGRFFFIWIGVNQQSNAPSSRALSIKCPRTWGERSSIFVSKSDSSSVTSPRPRESASPIITLSTFGNFS